MTLPAQRDGKDGPRKKAAPTEEKQLFAGNLRSKERKKWVKNILCCIVHKKPVSFLREGLSCAVLCIFVFSMPS